MYEHIIYLLRLLVWDIVSYYVTLLFFYKLGYLFEYLFIHALRLRCNCFTWIQTSHPHIYLYLGINVFTLISIIYLKPVSLTSNVLPFQTLLKPPSFFDFVKSLRNSQINTCIKYLPTIWVFLQVVSSRINIVYFVIGDVTIDGSLIIHSWIITFNNLLINGYLLSLLLTDDLFTLCLLLIKSFQIELSLLNNLYLVLFGIDKYFVSLFPFLISDSIPLDIENK